MIIHNYPRKVPHKMPLRYFSIKFTDYAIISTQLRQTVFPVTQILNNSKSLGVKKIMCTNAVQPFNAHKTKNI